MAKPKISIVTPSFNQGSFIEETIQSCLQQEVADLELIIIDGGSRDESVEIIRKYEKHLAYWISEPDRGQSQAINKGLRLATGDVVTWINSDDLLMAGALRKVAELFDHLPEGIGVIHGGTISFYADRIVAEDFGYDHPTIERYLSGMAFSQPSSFIRKRCLDLVGDLDEDLHYGMDYDLFARLALVTEFRKTGFICSKYRLHPNSKTLSADHKFIEDWIRTFIKVSRTLNAIWVLNEMDRLKVFDSYLTSGSGKYNFAFEMPMVDFKLMLFYFLTYVYKADYRNSHFDRARIIGKYLQTNYRKLISEDPDLHRTLRRLEWMPGCTISLARSLKQRIFEEVR